MAIPANKFLSPGSQRSTFVDVSTSEQDQPDEYLLPPISDWVGIEYELITVTGRYGKVVCRSGEYIIFRGTGSRYSGITFYGVIKLRSMSYGGSNWWEVMGGHYTITEHID